ncbi:MAG: hypothetical protein HKN40_12495 [Winogradskyella sp.]|uniref:hypothetical protein n=1 Tax=Winogradskyella sp. TaxID=1883156 RepID=UPI00181829B8|nr:hypothetical protein [Winogradskyella sp.]
MCNCINRGTKHITLNKTNCIENVIEKDSEFGKLRNHQCETKTLHTTIIDYTEAMRNINFENCPETFSVAFKNHITAWDSMGEFTKKYSELRGEMHNLFDSIKKTNDSLQFKILLKDIWNTWTHVEKAMTEEID